MNLEAAAAFMVRAASSFLLREMEEAKKQRGRKRGVTEMMRGRN
jgi:hypothetical protein